MSMVLLLSLAVVALVVLSNTESEEAEVVHEGHYDDKFHSLYGHFMDDKPPTAGSIHSPPIRDDEATQTLGEKTGFLMDAAAQDQDSGDTVKDTLDVVSDQMLKSDAYQLTKSKEVMHKSVIGDLDSPEDETESVENDIEMRAFQAKEKKEQEKKEKQRAVERQLEAKRKLVRQEAEAEKREENPAQYAEKKRLEQMISDPFSSNFSHEKKQKAKAELKKRQDAIKEGQAKQKAKLLALQKVKLQKKEKAVKQRVIDERDSKSIAKERSVKKQIFAQDDHIETPELPPKKPKKLKKVVNTAAQRAVTEALNGLNRPQKKPLKGAFNIARSLAIAQQVKTAKKEARTEIRALNKKYPHKKAFAAHTEQIETTPNHYEKVKIEVVKPQKKVENTLSDKEKRHQAMVKKYQQSLLKLHSKVHKKVHQKYAAQARKKALQSRVHKLAIDSSKAVPVKATKKVASNKAANTLGEKVNMEAKMAALQLQLEREKLKRMRADEKAKQLKAALDAKTGQGH